MPVNPVATWNCKELIPHLYPDKAMKVIVKLSNSVALAAGTVLGRIASTDRFGAYADTTTTDPASCLLGIDTAVDANGNHYYGLAAASEHDEFHGHTWAYINGIYVFEDLVGLDAGAVTNLGMRIIYGDAFNSAGAVLYIP